MQITTKSGFVCDIDPKVTENMELVDAMAELQGGDKLAYSRVCLLMLGKEVRAKLYDHVRTKDGRVPPQDVDRELGEIMDALGQPAKN